MPRLCAVELKECQQVGELLQLYIVHSQELAFRQLVKKHLAGSIYIQACF